MRVALSQRDTDGSIDCTGYVDQYVLLSTYAFN
jgi:hypothetical protein